MSVFAVPMVLSRKRDHIRATRGFSLLNATKCDFDAVGIQAVNFADLCDSLFDMQPNSTSRLVQRQSNIPTRITILSLDSPPISDLRSYYMMSHTSSHHQSDSRGCQGSRFSRSVAPRTTASCTTASPAVTNPRFGITNAPCLETFAQWPCSYVYLDLPEDDLSAEIQYLDLQDRASEVEKSLEEYSFLIGREPRSEKNFQQLLTDFVIFTHELLRIKFVI